MVSVAMQEALLESELAATSHAQHIGTSGRRSRHEVLFIADGQLSQQDLTCDAHTGLTGGRAS